MARDPEWTRGLGRLEAALKPGGKMVPPEQLPPGNSEAALMLGAREEIVENQWFRALRYVGCFAQGISAPSNPMSYILQGVSRDGRLFIMMRAPSSHPSLAKPGGMAFQTRPACHWQSTLRPSCLVTANPERILFSAVTLCRPIAD